jgi:hypothetical protein
MSDQLTVRMRGLFFQADGVSPEEAGKVIGGLLGSIFSPNVLPPASQAPAPAALPAPPAPAHTRKQHPRVGRPRARGSNPERNAAIGAPTSVDNQVLDAIRRGATQRGALTKATGLPTYAVARAVARLAAARRVTVTGVSRATRYVVRGGAPAKEED